jgi:hypothetical protein
VSPAVKSRVFVWFLIALLWIAVLTPLAILWTAVRGRFLGSIAIVAQLIFMAAVTWNFRKHRASEAERMRRIDEAMGKPSDDPRQMAQWIP